MESTTSVVVGSFVAVSFSPSSSSSAVGNAGRLEPSGAACELDGVAATSCAHCR